MSKIVIYTDGSSRGNPGPGGWGSIIISEKIIKEIGGRENHTTNNRMELMAVIGALEGIDVISGKFYQDTEILVHADSEYVVKGITLWIQGWVARGWKTSAKKPVLNQDLWKRMLEATKGKNIKWNVVAGHSGNVGNERCDVIATSFADNTDIDLYNGPISSYGYKL